MSLQTESRVRGITFQEEVANYLRKGIFSVKTKDCYGPDIEATVTKEGPEKGLTFRIEVKGISSLIRTDGKTARFTFNKIYLPEVDLIAFVIQDYELGIQSSIIFVQAEPVLRFVRKHKGNKVCVSLRQIRLWTTNGYRMEL